jgi:toxin ParE1/3/4
VPVARLSPAAEADVDEIWDYSEERWGRPQANRYVRDLDATCTGLAEGRVSSISAEDIRPGYRKAACGSHMIYFRYVGEEVEVVRILHQSMDVGRHL